MRRPPFALNGRYGALRGTGADGRPYRRTGRLTFIWDSWLQGVLAGTAEPVAEMRVGTTGIWHPVQVNAAEAREIFDAYRFGGALRIHGCERIRERRLAKGLPVTGELAPAQP